MTKLSQAIPTRPEGGGVWGGLPQVLTDILEDTGSRHLLVHQRLETHFRIEPMALG